MAAIGQKIIARSDSLPDTAFDGEISAIEPVVYINSANGKRVKPGMEVQVSPTTVRREEYGFMKGQIRMVGEYPVTSDAVKAVTGNDQLVEELLGPRDRDGG